MSNVITSADLSERHWGKYEEPIEFNIIVNDMREVLSHNDGLRERELNYSVQSSLSGGGYRVSM